MCIAYSNRIYRNCSIVIGYSGTIFSCIITIFISEDNCCSIAFYDYIKVDGIHILIICRRCFLKFIETATNFQSFARICFRSKGGNLFPTTVIRLIQLEYCTGKSIAILINFIDFDFIIRIPVVSVLSAVHIVWHINGTGYGISVHSTRSSLIIIRIFRFCYFCRCFCFNKLITVFHASFLNGIGGACREIEETNIPICLNADSKLFSRRDRIAS